jgi:Reverse transcriptase (RNA-dependent DNA polymerase)
MRVPPKYHAAMKRFLMENVKAGHLRPSSSSTSSGTFMTPKSDPTVDPRVVHDYRALNENTIKDHTPLQRQDAILERMVRAFIWGKIDLKDTFYQIRIREGDIYKTAIKTPFGLFEWVVTPQGLCNAPATFQRYMNFILREYIGQFCDPFMDDIGIYSNSVAEHKRHVALILQVLRDHGIVASEKSILFADRIEFMGHIISSKGIEPSSEKLGKISSWPTPRSASDIKSFFGFVNYLATNDFIPALADQSSVLTDLTKKNVAFRWEKRHDDTFKMIKKLAASIRLLQRIDYESGDTVWLIVDASSKGIGGYVAQCHGWVSRKTTGCAGMGIKG